MPTYAAITQDDFVAAVRTLATAIRASDRHPDLIVGIGRGGLVPATYLSHALGVPTVSVDWSSGIEAFAATPLAALTSLASEGRRLLFVDDISESGMTIGRLRAGLGGAPARFATLIDNCRSAERIDHAARTIDRAVTKDWFVFPWEAMADADSIAQDAAAVPGRIA